MKTQLCQLLILGLMGMCHIGCDEDSYNVEIIAYDDVTDQMTYQVKTIETINDLATLEGRATRIRGGISLEINGFNVVPNRAGAPVSFNSLKIDGVYYPADYDSLAMVSIYYNIEQAMLFFESLGMSPGQLGSLDTFYWADVTVNDSLVEDENETIVNNALYMPINSTNRGFYVTPFDLDRLDGPQIPLSMNPGIMVHEYTHAVFQQLILDELPTREQYPAPGSKYSINGNYRWAVNEGVADVFAVAFTGDPDFMALSIASTMIARSAASEIIYTDWMDRNASEYTGQSFEPYLIGAFVSATIYEITRRIADSNVNAAGIPTLEIRKQIATVTYGAMVNIGEESRSDFTPALFFSHFIHQLPAEEHQQIACDVLHERFKQHYMEVEGCP